MHEYNLNVTLPYSGHKLSISRQFHCTEDAKIADQLVSEVVNFIADSLGGYTNECISRTPAEDGDEEDDDA